MESPSPEMDATVVNSSIPASLGRASSAPATPAPTEKEKKKRKYVMTEARKLAFQRCQEAKRKKKKESSPAAVASDPSTSTSTSTSSKESSEATETKKEKNQHKEKLKKIMDSHYLSKIPFERTSSSSSISSSSSSTLDSRDASESDDTSASDSDTVAFSKELPSKRKQKESAMKKKASQRQKMYSKLRQLTKNTKAQFHSLHKKLDIQQQQQYGRRDASSLLLPAQDPKSKQNSHSQEYDTVSSSHSLKASLPATTNNFRFV